MGSLPSGLQGPSLCPASKFCLYLLCDTPQEQYWKPFLFPSWNLEWRKGLFLLSGVMRGWDSPSLLHGKRKYGHSECLDLSNCLWLCWASLPARRHQRIMEQDRLFPFFPLNPRKWARGDGALWERAWIYDGLSWILLGWTGTRGSGPAGKSDGWRMQEDAVAQHLQNQGWGIKF